MLRTCCLPLSHQQYHQQRVLPTKTIIQIYYCYPFSQSIYKCCHMTIWWTKYSNVGKYINFIGLVFTNILYGEGKKHTFYCKRRNFCFLVLLWTALYDRFLSIKEHFVFVILPGDNPCSSFNWKEIKVDVLMQISVYYTSECDLLERAKCNIQLCSILGKTLRSYFVQDIEIIYCHFLDNDRQFDKMLCKYEVYK